MQLEYQNFVLKPDLITNRRSKICHGQNIDIFLDQDSILYPVLTIYQNIAVASEFYGESSSDVELKVKFHFGGIFHPMYEPLLRSSKNGTVSNFFYMGTLEMSISMKNILILTHIED